MLQGVQLVARGEVLPVLLLLLLSLPLVLLLSLSSPLLVSLLLLATGAVYEAFSSPLYLIQQGEVALGTAHPGEGAVLHDGPHLRLVQLHEAVSVE